MSIRLSIIALIAVMAVAATYVAIKPALRRSPPLQAGIILADVILISIAYWLTGAYGSDFFLFYYLPIFASVEYFGVRGAIAISIGVGLAMVMVILFMHGMPVTLSTKWLPMSRVLLQSWLFLLAVALSSAFVFSDLSRRQAELLTLLDALHSSAAAVPNVQELDQVLESILSELTEQLKFEYATISLVDEYRDCIETVRGRNVSPGWIIRAKHQLNASDIQTHIVKTGETRVFVGWDDLLDRDIYERFEHWRLARVWAPIVTSDHTVVGTIEAGCNKDRADDVLSDSAIDRITRLGCSLGDKIARTRPHILLQGIARDAIKLIGADSASVHVYRRRVTDSSVEEDIDWGELIVAAGAGKATPEFVRSYQPRARGRGRLAVETGTPIWLDDLRQFQSNYPDLYERGVRAVAYIPLKLGSDIQGVLGIYFWRGGKKFTSRELNLAEMFAREMEGVIQNYLLLRRATETGSRAWALSGLQALMQSLTSPFNLSDVLQKIARNALLTLDADNVTVYQFLPENGSFYLPPVTDGQFMAPLSTSFDYSRDKTLLEFVRLGASQFIVDVRKHQTPDLANSFQNGQPRFVDREQVKSCAVLILRSSEVGEVVGLLFVNFRHLHHFSSEEKRAMDALATSAALAIRNARLHRGDLNRQLGAIHEVLGAIAEKGPDLAQVLERLLQQTVSMTGAKYGVCRRWNEQTEVLEPLARWPVREDYPIRSQTIDEGIIGLAAKSRKSILVEDVLDHSKSIFVETIGEVWPAEIYKSVNPDTRSEIAVPILDEDRLLGVLNIEHPEVGGLTQDDGVLLQTLSVPAIIAFHTVDLYKRLERRIRPLRALNLIAARVQEKPSEFDAIVRLFLTGITAGAGLGFSRAMLFLADQDDVLHGEFAVGAITQQQAEDVWDRFGQKGVSSSDDLDSLLQEAEELSEETMEGRVDEESPLSRAIRHMSFPIDHTAGAAAECLILGKTVTIGYNQPDPFREVLGQLTQPNEVPHVFAAVPLVGKHTRPIGVLIVDNRFLWRERAIEAEDIAGVEAAAHLLALSIENVRLQDSLAEEKRIENWKEVTGFIAHNLGTVLFEVKGDVRNLRGHIPALPNITAEEELGALFNELNSGISRAERVLFEFRSFANPAPLELEQLDLRQILREVFEPVHPDCSIEMSLSSPLPAAVDASKLGNALREIRKNALEAMADITDRPKRIRIKVRVDEDPIVKKYLQIEITDNGPGIPNRVMGNIFKPGVTTKVGGTGLGLPIVKSVIDGHGGTIKADNSPDGGARFTVRIPVFREQTTNGASHEQNSSGR